MDVDRTRLPDRQAITLALIRNISENIVHSMGGEVDLHIDVGYPCVYNSEKVNDAAMKAAETFLGTEYVSETELRMGAEDFGYYAQEIPACFFRLGTMNKSKGITSGVHTPTFNVDEDAIETGMGIMAWLGCSLQP